MKTLSISEFALIQSESWSSSGIDKKNTESMIQIICDECILHSGKFIYIYIRSQLHTTYTLFWMSKFDWKDEVACGISA